MCAGLIIKPLFPWDTAIKTKGSMTDAYTLSAVEMLELPAVTFGQ